MRILGMVISGSAAIGIFIFTIWAGFDWYKEFGSLSWNFWSWALFMSPLCILINVINFFYWSNQ